MIKTARWFQWLTYVPYVDIADPHSSLRVWSNAAAEGEWMRHDTGHMTLVTWHQMPIACQIWRGIVFCCKPSCFESESEILKIQTRESQSIFSWPGGTKAHKVHQPIPPIPEPFKSPQPQDSALDLWYLIYGRWTIVVKCCEMPSIHYAPFPSIWNNMATIST